MADAKAALDDADAAEGVEPPKRAFSLKLPSLKMLLIGAVVLAMAAGGGAYFYLVQKNGPKADAPAAKPVVFVDLPEVLVNLSNTGSDRTQYLKLKIVLELPEQKMIDQITPVMPRVMDTFQTYLRELRPSDLDGSAGIYRLREELTRRVNASIAPGRINAVLFKEIIVQ